MACSVDSCTKKVFSKGRQLCGMHYYRLLRNGSPDILVRKEQAKVWADRFWEKVDKTDDCWVWNSTIDTYGYGVFQLAYPGRKTVKAHRISYELVVGPIENGLTLDHLCYNRKCVNPTHLEPVTASENAIRAAARRKTAMDFYLANKENK